MAIVVQVRQPSPHALFASKNLRSWAADQSMLAGGRLLVGDTVLSRRAATLLKW